MDDRKALRAAKRNATLVLFFAFLVYCSSFFVRNELVHDFLRTAGEAGTVGGLADWFAVTALFRRPLGLPIPHTALIPNRKDQIGASISRFLQNNFLNKDDVVRELKNADLGTRLGSWLADEATCRLIAPIAAKTLQDAIEKGQHLDIITLILPFARKVRVKMRGDIEAIIAKITGRIVPGVVDKMITNRVAQELDRILEQLEKPDSVERATLDSWIRMQVLNIPEHLKGKALNIALELKSPNFLNRIWGGAPPEGLVRAISDGIKSLGASILNSPEYQDKINSSLELAMLTYVAPFGKQIGEYIERTVQAWDAKTITVSLENQVGKDLQFIRINGTVVGMIAGVMLFCISQIVSYM